MGTGPFVHLAVHHPNAGMRDRLAASMRRFAEPAEGNPALRLHLVLEDASSGDLVGLMVWDSEDAFRELRADMRAAVQDDPFGELWARPPDVLELRAVPSFRRS
jgi:hypothetical protein